MSNSDHVWDCNPVSVVALDKSTSLNMSCFVKKDVSYALEEVFLLLGLARKSTSLEMCLLPWFVESDISFERVPVALPYFVERGISFKKLFVALPYQDLIAKGWRLVCFVQTHLVGKIVSPRGCGKYGCTLCPGEVAGELVGLGLFRCQIQTTCEITTSLIAPNSE